VQQGRHLRAVNEEAAPADEPAGAGTKSHPSSMARQAPQPAPEGCQRLVRECQGHLPLDPNCRASVEPAQGLSTRTSVPVKWSDPWPAWRAASAVPRQACVKLEARPDSIRSTRAKRHSGAGWHPPRANRAPESHRGRQRLWYVAPQPHRRLGRSGRHRDSARPLASLAHDDMGQALDLKAP